MKEDCKERKATNTKLLAAAAVVALFLGGGHVMAAESSSHNVQAVQQQVQVITGTVVDTHGEPVIGANVVEKGTTNGGLTDIDGNFSLRVAPGTTIQVSFVGYKTVEVKAAPNMKVVLVEDTELLDEVVVVGDGTQKKENLTGSVSSVDVNKTLEGRPIADVGRGLQGTTPGLSIVVPSGEVGSDPMIKIRGQIGSIEGSASPLILLDNVEIPSIQMVNPDDIESISVLKDAASASIYGAKAAYGVILITTKKGAKTDRVDVSYQGNVSFQHVAKPIEMGQLNALEYAVDALVNAGSSSTVTGAFVMMSVEGLERAREWQQKYGGKLGVNDPYVYGRDWYVDANGYKIGLRTFDPYEYMIRDWAPTHQHNVSINGKSGKTTYNIGLGYLNQSGMTKPAKEDGFTRYNASMRISTELSKYVTVRAGSIFSSRVKKWAFSNSTTADPWYYLYRWGPNMPLGQDERGYDIRSPWSEVKDAQTAQNTENYLNINLGTTINVTKDWKFDFDYTYASEDLVQDRPGTRYTAADSWVSAVARVDENGNQLYVDNEGNPVAAGATGAMPAYDLAYQEYTAHGSGADYWYRLSQQARRHTFNATTDYNWQVNDNNNLKFLLGMNLVTYDLENNGSKRMDLSDLENPQYNLAVGTQYAEGNYVWEGQMGFFGRINYNFKEKYLLEANLRYDASSKFPDNLQWRWFPSFSAGWRVSEEAFMQWAKPALSSFKIRGSWGRIGDQSVPNNLYVARLTPGELSWLDASGNKLVYRGALAAVASGITWQDITTLDFGFDARFFNNEFGITFDWYRRDTENMIVPAAGVSLAFGAASPKGNYGSFRTRGWEVSLDYNHRFNNGLGINAMFTLSDALTEVTAYGDTYSIDDYYVGKKYGEIWGYRTDRLYQKEDFVYDANGEIVQVWALNGKEVPAGTAGAKQMNKLSDPNGVYQDYLQSGTFKFGPGDVKYTDLNGDGKIDDGSRLTQDEAGNPAHGDVEVIGNNTPRFEYGLRLGADYKGFDLSIFMQGVGKREVWGVGGLAEAGFSSDGAVPDAIASDYWKEDRTDAFYPRAYICGDNALNNRIQSRYLLDMSYFRIKNITFGYSLPKNVLDKAHIQKARLYMALENFFTFDNLRGLPIDPEAVAGYSMFNTSNYNSGRIGMGVPTFKSLSVGVQLTF